MADNKKTCPVCTKSLDDDQKDEIHKTIYKTDCHALMHEKCFNWWVLLNSNCPACEMHVFVNTSNSVNEHVKSMIGLQSYFGDYKPYCFGENLTPSTDSKK